MGLVWDKVQGEIFDSFNALASNEISAVFVCFYTSLARTWAFSRSRPLSQRHDFADVVRFGFWH